ncbi:MAG: AAA family ATPase [Deltaproteobacteria bacterium]|nr:AAA family ATPase [Candidatus Zymogenaceae bacterium]
MEEEKLWIVGLYVENIKNIRVVHIRPDGNAVILTGENGAGKSAALDALEAALTGKKYEDIIRHGETRAEVRVDMGDYIVTRVWTEKGDRLKVSRKGASLSSPQTFLNEIFKKISFDPTKFIRMDQEEQYKTMLTLAGVSLEKWKAARKEVYDNRTEANREAKRLENVLSTLTRSQGDVPDEEIDAAAQAAKVNGLKEQQRAFENGRKEIEARKARIETIERQIAVLEAEAAKLKTEKDNLESEIPARVEYVVIQAEEEKLSQISVINAAVQNAKTWNRTETELNEAKRNADELTRKIDEIDHALKEKVSSLQLPIDGLSLEGEQVTYNGILLSRLSDAEQILVSTAIAIAIHSTLPIVIIRDGSFLDSKSLEAVLDLATKHGHQVWVEKVDETGEVGIVFEDGVIVSGGVPQGEIPQGDVVDTTSAPQDQEDGTLFDEG